MIPDCRLFLNLLFTSRTKTAVHSTTSYAGVGCSILSVNIDQSLQPRLSRVSTPVTGLVPLALGKLQR